jgi:cytoskeletal protein RodZ
MVKKSVMSNSKLNSDSNGGWIAITVVLGIILLGLIGVLVYYLFFHNRDEKKPTPSPSSSPSPSKSNNVSSTPEPTKSKNELSASNLATIKTQFKSMGDDYDKLSDETKEKIKYCMQIPTPKDCEF